MTSSLPNFPQNPNEWPSALTYCGCDFRPAVCDMAKAVTELELWDYFKNYNPPKDKGFMFSTNANIHKLNNHDLVESHGHSGGSLALAKRYIQYLACHGWDIFERELVSSKEDPE